MKLDLFLPGLTSNLLDWERYYTNIYRYPSLEWILARSRCVHSQPQTVDAFLFNLFVNDKISHAPAAVLRHSDSPALCADPIHLKADTSDLYLHPCGHIRLDLAERQEMEALLNSHLSESGWEFVFTPAGGGVIKLDKTLTVSTTPLSEVSGKGITQYLPEGEHAQVLQRLMNEIQMLLHHAEFNKARVANGQLPANAVWLWGEGSLPKLQTHGYTRVVGSGEIEKSLSDLTGIPFAAAINKQAVLPEIKQLLTRGESQLIILRNLVRSVQEDDYYTWSEVMKKIDTDLFAPIKQQLQQGKIKNLRIMIEDGYYFDFKKTGRFNFWQRSQPLSTRLNQ